MTRIGLLMIIVSSMMVRGAIGQRKRIDQVVVLQAFPRDHWSRIRTTNGLERINKELKRRTRVVGAFPSENSFMRLGVSVIIDINEEWLTAKKYLSIDAN
jgi:transposase-like protein